MGTGYGYDDVYLVPNFGIVNSRSECDTSVRLGNMTFNLPVIPSNMKTVINADLAEYLAERNLFYVMHRFGIDIVQFSRRMRDKGLYVSISVGVNETDLHNLEVLKNTGIEPEYITIDVAHGYATYIKAAIRKTRSMFGNAFVIAGNVADFGGAKWLGECGANAAKVGIAAGAYNAAFTAYEALIASGMNPEDARMVLPMAKTTRLVMTMNFRELRHFFKERLDKSAQDEIRALAGKMRDLLLPIAPTVFGQFAS